MDKQNWIFRSPLHVQSYLKDQISFEREEFWVIALNSQLELLKAECLFRGTANECLVHPRDIFRFACLANAVKLILCHSHPSGSVEPSKEDVRVTNQIVRASRLMQIPIEDHVILGPEKMYSFRMQGRKLL